MQAGPGNSKQGLRAVPIPDAVKILVLKTLNAWVLGFSKRTTVLLLLLLLRRCVHITLHAICILPLYLRGREVQRAGERGSRGWRVLRFRV